MEYNDNSYYPGADAGDEQPKPRKPRRRGMWKLLWLIPVVLLAAGWRWILFIRSRRTSTRS